MDPGDPLSGKVLPVGDDWGTYLAFYGPYAAVILLLLVLAAIVSAAEAAFFSLTPDEQARCRTSARTAEKRLSALLDRPKRLLASLVIFNNLLNIAIVIIVVFVTWEVRQSAHETGWTVALVTFITALAIVLFGEIIPKVYASQRALAVARATSGLAGVSAVVFAPVAVLLVNLSKQIDKRIERHGYKLSADELNEAVELTGDEATAEEKGILKGIVNFANLTVRQAMQSRLDITAVDIDTSFADLMPQLSEAGYSRVPVYRESLDQVEGVLYLKDLLPHLHADATFRWQDLVRPAFFVPETKKINDLLQDFQEKRVHLAIVVDEYGGTRGLITLEDLIEEIFGDINDEFDVEETPGYRQLDPKTYIFEGKMLLTDVCRVLDVDVTLFDDKRGDSESLGGLLLDLFGTLPTPGETADAEGFRFTVRSADSKRIGEVEITKLDAPTPVASTENATLSPVRTTTT